MIICAAQMRPVKGDVEANIKNHEKLIATALSHGAETIIFPELSLTGYEPHLAEKLATDITDSRFRVFQELSDNHQIIIGAGMPIRQNKGVCIGMIIFQPKQPQQLYSKKYLHPDEEPFFVSGQSTINFIGENNDAALAICYELSIPEHAENAFKHGAQIYVASVAKTAEGVDRAVKRLAEISSKYGMAVLMANCVGECEGKPADGRSTVWSAEGLLLAQLNGKNEGVLIFNSETNSVIENTFD